jgi:hypothetical protein
MADTKHRVYITVSNARMLSPARLYRVVFETHYPIIIFVIFSMKYYFIK